MRIVPITAALLDLADALHAGDLDVCAAALGRDPSLATSYFGDEREARTALHVVTDFPGHVPHAAQLIGLLVAAGADVDAPFLGAHSETALHWAASCDDVDAIEALLDAGADIEATGGVLTGGPPLDDAVIFGQWDAARALVGRGARVRLFHAAALGLPEPVAAALELDPGPDAVTNALWHACRGGAAVTAELLLDAGGDPDWMGYDEMTPRDAAAESGDASVIALLASRAPQRP
jgi:hypothetical protein